MVVLNKGLIFSLLLFFLIFYFSFISLGEHFNYLLDDAYIHMGIAKNLVEFNNWGSSTQGFESASSSPIWTFLIAIFFFIFGVNDFVPLILNVIISIGIIISTAFFLKNKFNFSETNSYILSLLVFILIPGFLILFSGMEHLLQILFFICFTYFFLDIYFENKNQNLFYLLTFLMGAIRYESLFLLVPINFLFLYKKRYKEIILFSIILVLPIIIYGLISIANGSDFLPNSVLIKGRGAGFLEVFGKIGNLFDLKTISLFTVFPLLYLLRNYEDKKVTVLLFIIASLFILQSLIASIGWLMRYEAWFLTLLSITMLCIIKNYDYKDKMYLIICIMLALFFFRPLIGYVFTSKVHKNIYELNLLSGYFIQEYYNNKTIVIHDLGTVSYFADVNIIDLNGLATKEIQRKLFDYTISREFISEFTKDADIAIVFRDDGEYVISENMKIITDIDSYNWTYIGYFKASQRYISTYDTLRIYSISEDPEITRQNAIEFFADKGVEYNFE